MGRASFSVPGYVVEALLGSGASSEVWLGRTAGSGDPVALKRIVLRDATQGEQAREEAALLAELDHPNLVRLHEIVIDGTEAVLVLDLAAGGTLRDLIEARGSLSPGEVITSLAPIGSVLAYLHDAGVVHGDVTPANILFTDDGHPMLADLGVARLAGNQSTVRSTPAYIDPGVAAGFMPAPQSDVFMLGGVALHALTGRPLWPGATAEDALFAALAANLSDLDARLDAAQVPGEMRAVLRRALAIEPARRGTAADFALDLRYSAEPTAVDLDAGRTPDPIPVPPPAVPAVLPEPPPVAPAEPTPARTPPPAEAASSGEPPAEAAPSGEPPAEAAPSGEPPAPVGDPAQTYLVNPRPRPRRAHHYRRRRLPAGWARWGAAAVVLAALAGGGIAWGLAGDGSTPRATGPTLTAPPPATFGGTDETLSAPPSTATDGPSSAVGSAGVGNDVGGAAASGRPLAASDVLKVLQQLDALREQAFARRAPLLLTGVYAPGPLLDEDTASLERVVPSGCGLEGVRTTYADVKIQSQTATSITIDVRATLAQSVLFCDGVAKAKAAGSGPSALHMTLSRAGAAFLISAVTT